MQRPDATAAAHGADPDELISIAEAARRIGIDKSTLSRQVNSKAVRSHKGQVRLREVLEDRANNINLSQSRRRSAKRPTGPGATKPDATDATPRAPKPPARATNPDPDATGDEDLDGEELVLVDGVMVSFAQAQRIKENYLARQRQLEFEKARGALVDRDAALKAFFDAAREIRDAWTSWPARIATLLAADLGADERVVAEILARYVQQHLAELGEPNEPEFAAAG